MNGSTVGGERGLAGLSNHHVMITLGMPKSCNSG